MLATVGFTTDRPTGRAGTTVSARLIACACSHFGVTADELRSQRRHGSISRARWAIAHVLIDRVGWSLPRVGALLNKDHTSILYGWRKSQSLIRLDEDFYAAVELLEQQL